MSSDSQNACVSLMYAFCNDQEEQNSKKLKQELAVPEIMMSLDQVDVGISPCNGS